MALDFPLCHFECRFTATSSPDSLGADADRLEMRFWSASDRLDISAKTASIPSSWLVLIRNAKWCRDHGARVEGPDQALQFSQLAAIHAHWTAKIEASSSDDTGPRVSAIAVESNPINAAWCARARSSSRRERSCTKHMEKTKNAGSMTLALDACGLLLAPAYRVESALGLLGPL